MNKKTREEKIDFAGYFDLAKAAGQEDPEKLQDHELLTPLKDRGPRYPNMQGINEGGMKQIHAGFDAITGREVAIARMQTCDSADDLELFLREGRITACLEHPNIMPVYDISLDQEGLPFFTMKLIRGENLGKIQEKILTDSTYAEKFRLPALLEMFMKICDAIAYAHSRGVLHLDLKPANIEISDFGEVLVCDWGLARLLDDADPELIMKDGVAGPLADINRTIYGTVKGTPGYMAPEQASPGESKSKQTDIYALGAILYSILTLKKPITGDDTKVIIQKTVDGDFIEPQKRSPQRKIPHSLNAVVMKAMAKAPSERYGSVESLQREVRAHVEGFATEAENAPFHRLVILLFKRHAALTVLTSAAIVMLTFISTAFLQRIEENRIELEVNTKKLEEEQKKSKEEKSKRESISANTADILIDKATSLLKQHKYEESLATVGEGLKLKPSSEKALELKAILLVGSLQYEKAENTADKMTDYTNQYFKDMSSKYGTQLNSRGLLHPEEFIKLVQEIQDDRMLEEQGEYEKFRYRVSAHIEQQLSRQTFQRYSLSERLSMLKEMLELTNPQSSEITLNYELKEGVIKNFTLTNNSEFKRPHALTGLPIEQLNLENTGISEVDFVSGMPLKSLNIKNTSVHSLKPLAQSPLNILNLSKTPVTDIAPIVSLPLRTLFLGSSKVNNLNFINDFPYLKEVILPKNVYTPEETKIIEKRIKLIVY